MRPNAVRAWCTVSLARRLRTLGSFYGAMPAHDGLWDSARETAHDVAARLAIVPMVLEARALDVTPMTVAKFVAAGDERSARILQRIVDDEIRHVRFGTKHFIACAQASGEPPESLWKMLVTRHFRGAVKPPFNDSARGKAGLPRSFYTGLATPV